MPAISQSPRMFTEPIRDVLYHKLSPLGLKKGRHTPAMTMVLVVSAAVRKDPHLTLCLACLSVIVQPF